MIIFQVWKDQPTTQDLKQAKEEKRTRFGFEIDFENYEKPLEKSITRVTRVVREQKVNWKIVAPETKQMTFCYNSAY